LEDDWINLTRLTNAGIIGAAKQAMVPGARVVVVKNALD
jgi:hypothetical protein